MKEKYIIISARPWERWRDLSTFMTGPFHHRPEKNSSIMGNRPYQGKRAVMTVLRKTKNDDQSMNARDAPVGVRFSTLIQIPSNAYAPPTRTL